MAWRTADAPLPDPLDDGGRRHRADRRAAGARVLGRGARPVRGGPLAQERLTVNYRTPAEIMEVAADVLRRVDPDAEPARVGPRRRACRRARVPGPPAVPALVRAVEPPRIGAELPGGPARRHRAGAPARRTGPAALPGAAAGDHPGGARLPGRRPDLRRGQGPGVRLAWSSSTRPASWTESPAGGQDLYVAMTRATHRLTDRPRRPPPRLPSTASPNPPLLTPRP